MNRTRALRLTPPPPPPSPELEAALEKWRRSRAAFEARHAAVVLGTPVEWGDTMAWRAAQPVPTSNGNGHAAPAPAPLPVVEAATPRHYVSTPNTNATSVKASPGVITLVAAASTAATARFVKLFDTPGIPNVGSDTPVLTLIVPGGMLGTGFILPIGRAGLRFTNGIAFAITTGLPDFDTGACGVNEVVLNLAFR